MTQYARSLFVFRRDLRLADNTALNTALELSGEVMPCFIFDPGQMQPHPYQSRPGLSYMLAALEELEEAIQLAGGQLMFCHDLPERVLATLIQRHAIEAVFVNRDYTPFSRRRDVGLAEACAASGVDFYALPDALLNEPERIAKSDGAYYKKFTPFYHRAGQTPVALPSIPGRYTFTTETGAVSLSQIRQDYGISYAEKTGGRKQALAVLDRLGDYVHYADERNFPAKDGATGLSAHLKYGACSIREAYYGVIQALGNDHALLRELYWRDFFYHVAFHCPAVFGHAFESKYDALAWDNDGVLFALWRQGKTGFPIVDAGMRELNATGLMHNRVRMITASFLVKDLHIDWRWGERYFAQRLIDYDPCVNNGNWQWIASTGCDAQPYFRIFNPWLQQRKFDPDCRYIYRWIPELQGRPVKQIHQWDKQSIECDYPAPIVVHAEEALRTRAFYKNRLSATLRLAIL